VADDPSNAELAHRIEAMRIDLKEDFRELVGLLEKKVSIERYEIERRNRDDVHVQIMERIAAIEGAREKEKEDARQAQQKIDDQRRADRRLIFSALIAPILMLLLTLYLTSQGAGP
jgi:CHASE3 domain sensor protein